VPHAKAEEEVLYPEWGKLVGFADAAVPMVHEHEAIVERVERVKRADADDVDTLQELLYGLYALIGVPFRKEEDIQLPAFDAAPPEVTEAVLERMEAVAGTMHDHAH
jgi:hemerythrin HHE cation binding domain-containing protein